MRRFLYWYLPALVSVAFASLFAWGFSQVFQSDRGTTRSKVGAVEAKAASGQSEELDIVVVGDSLARGTGDETGLGIGGSLAQALTTRKVLHRKPVNLAVNGARTADLLALLQTPNVRSVLADAEVVVVSIGGNDLFGAAGREGAPPANADAVMAEILGRIESIVKSVREVNPRGRIFLIGLYNPFVGTPIGPMTAPAVNRWNARLVERFATDVALTVVQTSDLIVRQDRLSADRFHPGAEVYGIIGRRISEAI